MRWIVGTKRDVLEEKWTEEDRRLLDYSNKKAFYMKDLVCIKKDYKPYRKTKW